MNLQYAKDPVWANAEQTLIDLTIKWDGIAEELPFTASPTDSEAHGRAIFAAALNGDFGPVAAFVPPQPVPTQPPERRQVTPLEFIDRLTHDEQIAVVTATLQNPAVKLWYDKLLAASFVSFDDPRLSAGLDVLVQAGLLTAERRAEIIPEAIQVSEL